MDENKTYLIGIDSGTSGIKAVVFDLDGNELYKAKRKLHGITPYEDWYEEDMHDIWEKCCECLADVLDNINPENVAGMGITAQGDGLWMIDSEGNPVRPGMCFCDGRTQSITEDWRKRGIIQKTFDICGTASFASAMPAEVKWLESNMPEELEKASVFFHLKDWLFYKLTGIVSCDESDMSIPMLNAKTRKYDDRLFELFEIQKYREKFPKVRPTLENAGKITAEIAQKFGMKEDVLVIGGPMDIPACALGSGVIHDGQAATTIGTAAIHSVHENEPRPEPYLAGMTIAHCVPDVWIRLVSSYGGAPNLEWFLETVGKKLKEEAENSNKDIYDYCAEVIKDIPIGSNGVVYHPYIMPGGERAPFFKSSIKASFSGISIKTTIYEMLRAVFEGIAMAMVDCYSSVETEIREICVSGGGAGNDVWMQMFADAMGKDVVICEGTEFGAKGAAMCSGIALGIYKGFEDAVSRTVREARRFKPNPDKNKRYKELYILYKKGYEMNMEWWDMRQEFLKRER